MVLTDGSVVGEVAAVQENPADDLLVLATGALVPLRFVVGWDDERRVVIDPPDGLLELSEAGVEQGRRPPDRVGI